MKILKKTLVAAGIATAVSATGAAQAATITTPSTAAVPAYGNTVVNETIRTVISPAATGVQLGATEALNVDDSVTFTLSGGTWAAITSADLTDNGANATYSLVSGGAGTNSATYRVNTSATDAGVLLSLSANATITGTAIANGGSTNITATMSGFVGGIATDLFGSPLTSLAVNLVPMYSATFTPGVGVFDVATGFTTLVGTATPPSTSANGTANVVASAAAVANSTTTGVPTGTPTLGNQVITLAGPMTGVSAIAAASLTGATAAGAPSTPAVANGMSIDVANNSAYGTANAAGPHVITLTFDGTTSYDASSYTATVSTTADANGYAANSAVASGTTHTFTRNGSSFTTNSFGSLNKMTVTDRSGGLGVGGADGAVTITAFAADGTAVTCTGLTVDNVPNNGTVTIQGTDVIAACPGAKRIDGIVNSTRIQTTNTKLTDTGATSQSGINGGTTISN